MQGPERKLDTEGHLDGSSADAPRTLGKYEIVEQIGEGGFGVVFKGFDPFIKRHVAIKTCTSSDPQLRERYFQEAEIAGRLDHPNVVRIFDFGVEDDTPYLVQEFLAGEDLDQKIEGRQFVPYAERLLYLIHIARGLEYAHGQGIIHRDIKPANIRVLDDGTAKIMDFGIAKLQHAGTRITEDGTAVGTAAYLAPEQVRGQTTDRRTDIFSYGALAFELLTTTRPFQRDSISATLFAVVHDDPGPISLPDHLCPESLRRLILRCLEKDPESRFAHFGEIVAELDRVRRQLRQRQDQRDLAAALRRVAPAPPPPRAAAARLPGPGRTSGSRPAAATRFDPPIRHEWTPPSIALRRARRRWLVVVPAAALALAGAIYAAMVTAGLQPLPFARSEARPTPAGEPSPVAPSRPHGEAVAATAVVAALDDPAPADAPKSEPVNDATDDEAATRKSASRPPLDPTPNSTDGAGRSASDRAPGAAPETRPPPPVRDATLVFDPGWDDRMTVAVDGSRPLRLDRSRTRTLASGSHTLTFSLVTGDYRAVQTLSVTLAAGEQRRLSSPIARPGQISVQARLGAPQGIVHLDGRAIGSSPLRGLVVAPGGHRLQLYDLEDPGRLVAESTVQVRSGQETVVTFDPTGRHELAVRRRQLDR